MNVTILSFISKVPRTYSHSTYTRIMMLSHDLLNIAFLATLEHTVNIFIFLEVSPLKNKKNLPSSTSIIFVIKYRRFFILGLFLM